MLKTAIFAGSFDPFTMGHFDIASRAGRLFDRLVIAVADNTGSKKCKLTLAERTEIVQKSVETLKNVEVKAFSGFLVNFALQEKADTIVRGLRTSNDFEYEKALTEVYKSQNAKIETMYLISSHQYAHISGSTVRELAALAGNVTGYVHPNVEKLVQQGYRENVK